MSEIDATVRHYTTGLTVVMRTAAETGRDAHQLAAEVLRLREINAAWEWLAANEFLPERMGPGVYWVYYRDRDGDFMRAKDASGSKIAAADPVALCDALDKDWRKA